MLFRSGFSYDPAFTRRDSPISLQQVARTSVFEVRGLCFSPDSARRRFIKIMELVPPCGMDFITSEIVSGYAGAQTACE